MSGTSVNSLCGIPTTTGTSPTNGIVGQDPSILINSDTGETCFLQQDGTYKCCACNSVIVSSGVGTPIISGGESAGDIYIDESTGDIYAFDGTNWVSSDSQNASQVPTTNNGINTNTGDVQGDLDALDNAIGDVSTLTTTAGDLTGAINELDADITILNNNSHVPAVINDTSGGELTFNASGTDNQTFTPTINSDALATLLVTGTSGNILNNNIPSSTEALEGLIEIASQTEVNAGTDDVRAVTPLKLKQNLISIFGNFTDVYKEETFTPTLEGIGGGSISISTATRFDSIRIGDLVHVLGRIEMPVGTASTAVGQLVIKTLPQPNVDVDERSVAVIYSDTDESGGTELNIRGLAIGDGIRLYKEGGKNILTSADLSTLGVVAGTWYISITYKVA